MLSNSYENKDAYRLLTSLASEGPIEFWIWSRMRLEALREEESFRRNVIKPLNDSINGSETRISNIRMSSDMGNTLISDGNRPRNPGSPLTTKALSDGTATNGSSNSIVHAKTGEDVACGRTRRTDTTSGGAVSTTKTSLARVGVGSTNIKLTPLDMSRPSANPNPTGPTTNGKFPYSASTVPPTSTRYTVFGTMPVPETNSTAPIIAVVPIGTKSAVSTLSTGSSNSTVYHNATTSPVDKVPVREPMT